MTEKEAYGQAFENGYQKGYTKGYEDGKKDAVKHGRWVHMFNAKNLNNWVECSECKTVGSPFWKRCPVCEARMDSGIDG